MNAKVKIVSEPCPVARVLQIIGDKWSILVLRDLFQHGPRRFQDFVDSLHSSSPNVISARLKKLASYGIITTVPYSEHPPRNEYVLTKLGESLDPVLLELKNWGETHTKA